MGPQAEAELDRETVGEHDPEMESDMLSSFADSDAPDQSTASPTDPGDKLANPDDAASTPSGLESSQAGEPADTDDLATALSRLSQLEAVSKSSADSLAGRLGSMEQIVKILQAQTKTGQPVRLTMEDFNSEFASDYPEFVKAQVDAINKVLSQLQVMGLSEDFTTGLIKKTETAAETAADKRTARIRSESCRDDLDETHPGWRALVGLPEKDVDAGGIPPATEYRRWLAAQPKEYQERIGNSYSAVAIGRSIDAFNNWKQGSLKPKLNTKPALVTRQHRLHSTVVPKTSGSQPRGEKVFTEEEAMMAAFQGKL